MTGSAEDIAQAAILAAVAKLVQPFGAVLEVDELRCREWRSLTLTGWRHELDVRLVAGDWAIETKALRAITAHLRDLDFGLGLALIVADIRVEQPAGHTEDPAAGCLLTIAALVLDA